MNIDIEKAFQFLQKDAKRIAESKGWTKGNDGEALALMHSELSEALEWIRRGDNVPSDHLPGFTGVEEELADVVIRIANYAALRDLNIGGAVIAKTAFNAARPHRHGGKRF